MTETLLPFQCSRCRLFKPWHCFYRNRRRCKSCHCETVASWRRRNRERQRAYDRKQRLLMGEQERARRRTRVQMGHLLYGRGKKLEPLVGLGTRPWQEYLAGLGGRTLYDPGVQLDFVVPLRLFDLMCPEEREAALHHTNTRLILAKSNRVKGGHFCGFYPQWARRFPEQAARLHELLQGGRLQLYSDPAADPRLVSANVL